jgi:hypothetical protein
MEVRHTHPKELTCEDPSFEFNSVADWFDYQADLISKITLDDYKDSPIFTDKANLFENIPYKNKVLIKKDTEMELYVDRIVINGVTYPFDQVMGITVLGKNKLNVYHDGHIWQLKGDKRFCALKYVNIYNHYKNLTEKPEIAAKKHKEEIYNDREFLGL